MLEQLLVTTLGSTIAKLCLGWWLKNPDFVTDATSGVVDFLSKLTGDVIAARRGNREYEILSEKAAERISYFLDCEFWGLKEKDLAPICLAVSETIKTTNISLELIIKRNLDPSELTNYYNTKSRKYTRDFSDAEKAIYQRLLSEACTLAIEFSSRLPNFTQRTLSEILKREESIITSIDKVSEQVEKLQKSSYESSSKANRAFDIEYRRAIIRNLGWMELFGADLSSASRKHSLNIAYINLSIRRLYNKDGKSDVTMRADQAINVAKNLYIRGAAGSGKTTLLKWIAVNAASENFEESLVEWNYLTPFFIKLRQCVSLSELPSPEMFPKFIAPNIYGDMPDGWVHSLLKSGEAIILIDGVDEISRRKAVKRWVEDLTSTFDKTRFIITSRPLAQSEHWEAPKGFVEAELLPMEPTDISLFIENWHEAVKVELQEKDEIEEMEALCEKLKTTVHKNNNVKNLASTPLLCAMICALHKDKSQQLPSNRLDLYEACTKMLVEERERAREIKLAQFPDFSYKEKILLLSDLAYYLLDNGWSEIPITRARDRIAKSIRPLRSTNKRISPNIIINFLVERTGLLREPAPGILDFAHRTFQEYLSAKKAVDEDEIGKLIKNAKDAQWREVIILSAGLANRKQKQELLENLILTGDYDQQNKYWFHFLAVACLETMTDVDPQTLEELKGRIELLIPPKNTSECIALASAGDLVVPHLSFERGPPPKACVATLENIYTPNSIMALIEYINLPSDQVESLLLPVIDRISNDEKGKTLLEQLQLPEIILTENRCQLLKYINKIDKLTIQGFHGTSIPYINTLHTREMEILDCPNLTSLHGLANVTALRQIKITNNKRLNLTELSKCTRLTSLTLEKLSLLGIDAIESLAHIKTLSLINLGIKNLSVIAGMTGLKKLTLDSCTELNDVRALDRLFSLRHIVIRNCNSVTDLRSLEKSRKLQVIDLIFNTPDLALKIKKKLDLSLQSKVSIK